MKCRWPAAGAALIGLLVYGSYLPAFQAQTGAIVELVELGNKHIVVKSEDETITRVVIPKVMASLLTEGEEYFVTYSYTKLHPPKLIMIERIEGSR